jgi:hypothetical protein
LNAILASPLLGGSIGLGFAVTLLLLLATALVYAGIYYSVPRVLLKWLSRRALRVL